MRWRQLGGNNDPVPEGRWPSAVDRGRRIGIVFGLVGYRMNVSGADRTPPTGPLVVVANHTAFIDGPLLFGLIPRRVSFLVKAEVVVGPLGWLLRAVGQYAITRTAPERGVLMSALDQLRAGGVIGIFPEGQRTAGDVATVFNGAGWLAVRAGATVLPVAMRGTAKPGRWKRFRPRVRVRIGEPFDIPAGSGKTAIDAATARIQRVLAAQVAALDAEIAGVLGVSVRTTDSAGGADPVETADPRREAS